MSFTKKVVASYSKSLFQNVKTLSSASEETSFDISQIISSQGEAGKPTIYLVGEELSLIRSLFVSSKKLQQFFQNPTYSEQQKLDLLFNFLPGLSLVTKSFLKVLTERSHFALLPEIGIEYERILSQFQNITHVRFIVASILQETYGESLLKTLKELTGAKEILFNVSYNPKLLGGFIVEYNSVSIDSSILKEFSLFFSDL